MCPDLFTLWNAYTSYELSSFLSRTQICEHFKDPTINSQKRKPSLLVKLLGYAIFGKFLLGKETLTARTALLKAWTARPMARTAGPATGGSGRGT